jgi:hypothetical protein
MKVDIGHLQLVVIKSDIGLSLTVSKKRTENDIGFTMEHVLGMRLLFDFRRP